MNERVSELLNSKKKVGKKSTRAALFALKDKVDVGKGVASSWFRLHEVKNKIAD